MDVHFLQPEDAPALAEFVASHPHGSIEQSWDWGVLQTTVPGRDRMYVLAVMDEGSIVASMLLVRQNMGMGKCWLWCPRGPLLPSKNAYRAWKLLREACQKIARQEGDVFLRVEPGMPHGHGFEWGGARAHESYLPEHSLILDLEPEENELLKQMTQKGRYNIRQAHKRGVYIKKGDLEELDEVYDLLKETAERDGFHIHDKHFYEAFFDALGERAHLYLAKIEEEYVGALFATHFADTATYYFGASANRHRRCMAPYALQWFAIQDAKKAGCVRYDFLGIAPPGDRHHRFSGVTQFKTRFGGERVQYKKASVFVYRRLWYVLRRIAKCFR